MSQFDRYLSKIESKVTQKQDVEIFFKAEHDGLVRKKNDKKLNDFIFISISQVNLCCHF